MADFCGVFGGKNHLKIAHQTDHLTTILVQFGNNGVSLSDFIDRLPVRLVSNSSDFITDSVYQYRLHLESTNDKYPIMVFQDDGEDSATLRIIFKSAHIDL